MSCASYADSQTGVAIRSSSTSISRLEVELLTLENPKPKPFATIQGALNTSPSNSTRPEKRKNEPPRHLTKPAKAVTKFISAMDSKSRKDMK